MSYTEFPVEAHGVWFTFEGTYRVAEGPRHEYREWIEVTEVWTGEARCPEIVTVDQALAACGMTRAELEREWLERVRDEACSADEARTERAMEGR